MRWGRGRAKRGGGTGRAWTKTSGGMGCKRGRTGVGENSARRARAWKDCGKEGGQGDDRENVRGRGGEACQLWSDWKGG